MARKTISFNIDETDLLKLDKYATNLERDRSYILNQAVKSYIAAAEREAAEIEEASRGPVYTIEQVLKEISATNLRHKRKAS